MTYDRSQRRQTEEDLRRLGHTHAVLSRCNRSLARALDERALLIQTVRTRDAQAQAVRRLRNDAEREARGHLAATLHDGVGQTMQALNLGLKQARALAEREETVPVTLLDQLVDEAGAALRELRAVSCELRPLFLERLSLLDAIRHQCNETAQRTGAGPAGLGLCMIQERAAAVLGRSCVRSSPSRGTIVRICVPLTKDTILCP